MTFKTHAVIELPIIRQIPQDDERGERQTGTNEPDHGPVIVLGASAPGDCWIEPGPEQASDQPAFQATADRPTDRPTRRRRGSPRDASRLRAVVRLRCEPLHFANSLGRERPPRAPSSPSARVNPRRSAIAGARARDFPPPPPPPLSPSHRKRRRCARERSSSVSVASERSRDRDLTIREARATISRARGRSRWSPRCCDLPGVVSAFKYIY